ncbi:MAG: VOC family protein [Candidatus Bathyarchaeota archaeon]|nr:VOC family protein [Candidatus Bathyarchaeota archaeon]
MFVHVSVRVSDMDRSVEFYSGFLGLELKSRREIAQNNAEIAFLQDPEEKGALLELTCYRDQKEFLQADYEKRVFDHLAFTVTDLNSLVEAMRKAGVTITDEPYRLSATGSLMAFVEDPNGTLIELIERSNAAD